MWLKTYIRFWVSWLLPLLPSKRALAMTKSTSQNSFAEKYSFFYNAIHTSGLDGTNGILADSNAASLDGSAKAASADQVATNLIELPVKLSAGNFGSSKAKKRLFSSFAFRRLGTALGLLFFAALFTLGSKRQARRALPDLAAAKEPEAMIAGFELSDDRSIAEATARLKNVKGLLPAASRLASAVNSAESEKLIAEVEQVLKKSAEVTTHKEELEGVVTVALKALQKLQQIAIEGAAAIVEADSFLVNFSSLSSQEKKTLEARRDLEEVLGQPSLRSFFNLYKSLNANEVCLSQRFAEVAERITTQEKFENETHGERLLSTAIAIEALQDISAWRRHFTLIEEPLSENVVCATKFLLLAAREGAIKEFERCREYLKVGAVVQRDLKKAASEPLDSADDLSISHVEQSLEILDAFIMQLREDVETLRASTSVEDMIATGREAASLERKARELIRKSAVLLESFSGLSADLTATGRELVAEAARKAHQAIVVGHVSLLLASQDMRGTLKHYDKDVSFSGSHHVNVVLGKQLTELGFELETKARQLVQDSSWLVSQVEQMKGVDAALDLLKRLNSGVVFQIRERNNAETLYLDSRLLLFIESDLRATIKQVGLMVSKGDRLSGEAKQRYREAERKFIAARKAAAQAMTFSEAAEAAESLRTHALAMQALLFSIEDNGGDI